MRNLRFLILLIPLLLFPIVRADGCGLKCPTETHDLLEWTLKAICLLTTWSICHIASFVITLIIGIVLIFFWYIQPKEKKRKIKYGVLVLLALFFIAMLYPYLKTFAYTPVSNSTVNPPYCGDGVKNGLEDCEQDADCDVAYFCEKNDYEYDCNCRPRCDSPLNHFDVPDSDDIDYGCLLPTWFNGFDWIPVPVYRMNGTGLGYNGVPNNDEDYYNFCEVGSHFTASINNAEWCLYFKNEANVFYPITDRCDYCCVENLTSDVLSDGCFILTVRRVSGTGYPTPYELNTNYNPSV